MLEIHKPQGKAKTRMSCAQYYPAAIERGRLRRVVRQCNIGRLRMVKLDGWKDLYEASGVYGRYMHQISTTGTGVN